MIKWDGYGKLLKQSFFTLLISCFILLGSSFVKADWVVRDNGTYGYSSLDNSIDINVVNKGQLMSQRLGQTKRMLALASNDTSKIYFFWSSNQRPYIYVNTEGKFYQGFLSHYYVCPLSFTGISNLNLSQCSEHSITDNFAVEVGSFFDSITVNDFRGYYYDYRSNNCYSQYTIINDYCFASTSSNSSICFKGGNAGSSEAVCQGLKDDYTNSLGIGTGTDFTFINDGLLNTPPGFTSAGGGDNGGGSSVDNGGISLSSDDSALNYYEKHYGRDESICYAGVNSLSYLYGQNGVSFQEGQGLSIFEIFEQLYGNTDLDKVYVWLNSRLINYENRFDSYRDEPSYLANYNSGTNQVDIYYDNLTFPFANKPVAFYFLASNITSQSERNTMGSSVVSYCNIKINSGTFDEIIDQSQKNNITNYTEKSNTNIGLNPDGTVRQYTGAFLGSGVEIAFSGNTSIKNTLKNFFDELNSTINVVNSSSTTSILPSWLVVAFLTVVLFRFLKRKK